MRLRSQGIDEPASSSAAHILRFAAGFSMLALVIYAGPAASADEDHAASIAIDKGETYVIHDAQPSIAPEILRSSNPPALIVGRQADGGVLVLGAAPGTETIRVTARDGRSELYTFIVRAVGDADRPLSPGVYSPPLGEKLDSGAGPVTAENAKPPAAPSAGSASQARSDWRASSLAATGGQNIGSQNPPPTALLQELPEPSGKFADNPPAADSAADSSAAAQSLPEDTIFIRFGSSRIFDFTRRIKRVSVADSEIADLQVIDPHQLMLIGRKPGFTTLAVWDDQRHYEERQVRVEQSGRQQVMLNVVVAQLDRDRIEAQGIDYSAALSKYGVSLTGLPGQVASPYTPGSSLIAGASTAGGLLPSGGSIIPLILSSNLTYALAAQNSNLQTQTFFHFLEANSLARVLAQPRLVANSGEEAKFLSGGEIPIVIAQALNTTIVFKQFGTSVVFVPTVIGKHQLELVVKPEVSKPDFTQGVSLFGFVVPAFITQRAETVVKMDDNQTLIIAGLILRDRMAVVQKIPYLGDLPFVGGLFRNTSFQDSKSELVITVCPQIVSAIPQGAQVSYPARGPMTREELRTGRLDSQDASRPRF